MQRLQLLMELDRLNEEQQQTAAATNIQRVFRGNEGRKIARDAARQVEAKKAREEMLNKQVSEYKQKQQEKQNARERISSALLRSKVRPVVSEAIEEVKAKKQK